MLDLNLATRPFYDRRIPVAALAGLGLLVALWAGNSGLRFAQLSSERATLNARIDEAAQRTREAEAELGETRTRANGQGLTEVRRAVEQATRVVEQKAFSWTRVLEQLERALPPRARVTSIVPTIDVGGTTTLTVTVIGRGVPELDQFMEALQATGAFRNVLSIEEHDTPFGELEATVQADYAARAPGPAGSGDEGTAP